MITADDSLLSIAIERASMDFVERQGAYDAIVIGAGAAGGLAAALLCEAGLNALVLDAGWRAPFWQVPLRRSISSALEFLADPRALQILPPKAVWRGARAMQLLGRLRQPVQSGCYAWPTSPELFVDDKENPYDFPADRPFNWIRARGLGGRMAVPVHGRQYMRHGLRDFRPVDGLAPDWPFAPNELDQWYALVEAQLKLSGRQEHSPWVPDSSVAEERAPTHAEQHLIGRLVDRYPGVTPMLGRFAPPMPALAAAAATGRLALRQGAIAANITLDERGRADAVAFYDRRERGLRMARAPLVFLAASTLESTRILLASKNDKTPEGIGGRSGALGRFVMDHVSIKAEGTGPDLGPDRRQPGVGQCVYLPRFEARETGVVSDSRGFGIRIYQSPGPVGLSYFTAVADGEMLPRAENCVTLSGPRDAWGLRTLQINVSHSPSELELAREQANALEEVAALADVRLNQPIGAPSTPGSAIHECGSARMGDDPANSVLDPHNEAWDAPGLFVTDGAAFPSEGLQNPTLTIMALTARACHYAARRA